MTITLDEETARWARIEAAKRDVSVSRLIRDLLRQNMRQNRSYEVAMRRWLSRPPYIIDEPGTSLPKREELYDRPVLR